MTAIPGLHQISFDGVVNAYLLETSGGLVLVDTGLPGASDLVFAALGDRRPELIVLTHGHMDHSGGLADVRARTGAPVAAHPLDAELMGTGETGRPSTPSAHCPDELREMLAGHYTIEPATFDVLLNDGDTVPGFDDLRVVHVPGHSAGQIALLWDHADGVLIAADSAVNPGVLLEWLVAEDHDVAGDSLRRLAALDFESAVFGHGEPIAAGASTAFRAAFA